MKRKPKPKLLTERAIKAYVRKVYEVGRSRCKSRGEKFNPEDFTAGAMVVFDFINRLDLVPAEWFFGMHLLDVNPFDPERKSK